MIAKIGFHIETKSAKEQNIFLNEKYKGAYYKSHFEHLVPKNENILFIESSVKTLYKENGDCINSVVFEIHSEKPLNKVEMRTEILNNFNKSFNNQLNIF